MPVRKEISVKRMEDKAVRHQREWTGRRRKKPKRIICLTGFLYRSQPKYCVVCCVHASNKLSRMRGLDNDAQQRKKEKKEKKNDAAIT